MLIASYYTDDQGRSPYYVGKQGQIITSDFGWGIRCDLYPEFMFLLTSDRGGSRNLDLKPQILHPRMGGTGHGGPIGQSQASTGPNPPL
ncbi:hypothetical protein SK128_005684 [Halocaridina rubra]|uniref:Uncharacterized protein n=1 Tax=Halocaridina rubra TaxID=373956 RepID=A0AAN9A189_HALRR